MWERAVFLRDSQAAQPVAWCHYCGRGLYDDEEFYAVNGMAVCDACLAQFARGQYASCRMSGREWRRS